MQNFRTWALLQKGGEKNMVAMAHWATARMVKRRQTLES